MSRSLLAPLLLLIACRRRKWVAPRVGGYQAIEDMTDPRTPPPGRGSASP